MSDLEKDFTLELKNSGEKPAGKGMLKFSSFIVRFKWVFVAIFIALTIVSAVMMTKNKVNYDLTGYMPKDSGVNTAMQVLDEFDDKGMAYVMIKGVSESEVDSVAEGIKSLDGIANVAYDKRTAYKNGNVLYTVTLTDYDSTEKAFAAVEGLMDYLSDKDAYYTGQSAYSYYTRQETEQSILKIGIVIVIAILLMLLFTSKTYFELIIMILVFGVAVLLNMGTNFLFNGISYISNLVSLVLQLALSIDYSVILLHRYMEEKSKTEDAKEAVTVALAKGMPEILSSSLTTIVGLCALMFMSLPIGVEIGLALAKSIVMSLISVLFLMPALLVLFHKPLEKTKHKSFVPNVTKPARFIVKGRKVIVPLFLVLIILAGTGQFYNKYAFNMNGAAVIVDAQDEINEGGFGTLNSLVVIVPKGDYAKEKQLVDYVTGYELIDSATALSAIEVADGVYLTDSFTKAEFIEVFTAMSAGSEFESVVGTFASGCFSSYLEENVPGATADTKVALVDLLVFIYNDDTYSELLGSYKDMLGQLVFARANLESENYARLTFNINAGIEAEETFKLIKELKEGIKAYYPEYYMTGESVVCYEMSEYFPRDNTLVSVFTIVFILLILLLTFRNLALPVILILAIQGGIWINFVIPFLAGNSVSFIGYLIICAVQMGATIDYAIVLTNRYRSTRHEYIDRFDAMAASENAVFPTIITSGTILTVTGFTLGLASSGVVAQLGTLLGIGTLTSMLIVIFVLPSLLLVTEKFAGTTDFKKLLKKNRNKAPSPTEYDELPYVREAPEKEEITAE